VEGRKPTGKTLLKALINHGVADISVLGLKELLGTTGNMLTKQKVLLEWHFS